MSRSLGCHGLTARRVVPLVCLILLPDLACILSLSLLLCHDTPEALETLKLIHNGRKETQHPQ
jgi:hypothetical protein